MATVPAAELEKRFDELFKRAAAGEEVVVAGTDDQQMKLVPIIPAPKVRRRPGTLKGLISVPDSFFDPLPEDELRRWEGG